MSTRDLDRLIAEVVRIRRLVQVYSELFGSTDSTDVLKKRAGQVFAIVQRSMHDDTVVSLRRLFDQERFERTGQENLSLKNVVSAYANDMTDELREVKQEIFNEWEALSLTTYANKKVAHNDKSTMLGLDGPITHKLSSVAIDDLLSRILNLIVGLKAAATGQDDVSLPVDKNDRYESKGCELIAKLRGE